MAAFTRNRRAAIIRLFIGLLAAIAVTSAQAATVVADATASSNLSGIMPWTANLDASRSQCTGSYACQYHWSFGDGSASDPSTDATGIKTASHIYKNAGNYTVTLTVTMMVPTGVKPQSSTTVLIAVLQGETLSSYVNTCKQQLAFTDADVAAVANKLNCNKGVLFAPGPAPVNDYLGYARINDGVDLVFACRWANNGFGAGLVPPFNQAVSIELLMHNRSNGNTCFFAARASANGPSTTIVSPTVAAAAAPDTLESNYWNLPIELDRSLVCVNCHVAGPYISTPRIAPFLAQFGLLNDGHDTFGLTQNSQGNVTGRYHAVGSTFNHFNSLMVTNNGSSSCTSGCHNIGFGSTQVDILAGLDKVLLPSIASVIDNNGTGSVDISIANASVMPANGSPTSNYRWVNMDTPTNGDGVESETLVGLGIQYPNFYCSNPSYLEAHVVGSDNVAGSNNFSEVVRTFNLRDGLRCVNSDQSNGKKCYEYQTSYQCGTSWTGTTDGWTAWQHNGTAVGTGTEDNELRSSYKNLCATPSAIKARYNVASTANPLLVPVYGPNDRLAQFNNKGLICNNVDQGAGQTCSNYVVRFVCNSNSLPPATPSFKSSWSSMVVSATTTQNDAETRAQPDNASWNSQNWVVEPVRGSNYVRLKNVWTGRYLNVQSEAEYAKIVTYDLNTDWTSEQWIVEPVANGNDVRLKNVWAGKYLTASNNSNYSPVLSQTLNTTWLSQRWQLQ